MEFLIEFLCELLLEGSIEISSNKKVSKWIRYPLIVLIIGFFCFVIFGLIFVGIMLLEKSLPISIFILLVGIAMFIMAMIRFREIYLQQKKN